MRFWIPIAALPLLCVASCGGGDGGRPRSVLLVTVDTLRADRLGCYDYVDAETPNIDSLARRGVRFEKVFSTAPITLPSHTSLLTGTIPPYHGARDNGNYHAVQELLSIAEILREEGLRTAAFTAAYVLDPVFGLDQGFEVYRGVQQRQMNPSGSIEERSAREVNRDAFAWLETLKKDEPFFLWVHYFEPHLPYPPPEVLPPYLRERPYDAEVSLADQAFGELVGRLEELDRGDETLVVLTSDHGESLGEHGERTHTFFVYQGVLAVPLILSHRSLPRGVTVAGNASLVDVMPTILEILGLDPPALPPPGRSLVPAIEGGVPEDRPVYFESLCSYLNYGWAPSRGVARGKFKWIDLPRAELYDLSADPTEERNLLEASPDVVATLREELNRLLDENEPPWGIESARRDLTAEDRRRLAALGYAGAAFPDRHQETLADPKDGIDRVRREEEIVELFRQGRADEGRQILEVLLEEDPNSPIFNSHYASLLAEKRSFGEAIKYARRSVELGFRTAENLANLGMSLAFTSQFEEAREALEAALEINPKHLLSLFWLAQIDLQEGRYEQAKWRLETILNCWEGGKNPTIEKVRELLAQLRAAENARAPGER